MYKFNRIFLSNGVLYFKYTDKGMGLFSNLEMKQFSFILLNRYNFYEICGGIYALKYLVFKRVVHFLFNSVVDLVFSWFVKFSIIGYHYTIRVFKNRQLVKLRMGFKYRIFLVLPRSIQLVVKKRFFTVIGCRLRKLVQFCKYMRNLRNLFPYKSKGLVFISEKLRLKPGKKSKLR
jgi:hypothetical protein